MAYPYHTMPLPWHAWLMVCRYAFTRPWYACAFVQHRTGIPSHGHLPRPAARHGQGCLVRWHTCATWHHRPCVRVNPYRKASMRIPAVAPFALLPWRAVAPADGIRVRHDHLTPFYHVD